MISGRAPVVRLELQDMLATVITSLSIGSRRMIPSKTAFSPCRTRYGVSFDPSQPPTRKWALQPGNMT